MPLQLFNTLSCKTEVFEPSDDKLVRMYSCGPTVYDYGHIGNFRTFVLVDLLRRFLRLSGYKLKHVMNITDVDDKIIRNAASEHVDVATYTQKYEQAFLEDSRILNLEPPEILAYATDHISEMAEFIAALDKKGYAYRTDDGSYYFRIAKFPQYGKLSKKDFAGMEDGARVDVDEYEKDNARDFALWKAPKPGEAQWQTSIGPGRPGWHIECSVMSMKYLGESFDIHLGGEDLIFPHHENEIAQSEALTGKTFVRYWVHVRFLLVEGEKMSKSLGNFYTLRDLILLGHKPSSIRYLLASVPYRRQLNFTFDGLKQAAESVRRLRDFKLRLETDHFPETGSAEFADLGKTALQKMRAAMEDDLNTAEALAAIFEMIRPANVAMDAGKLGKQEIPQLLQALEEFDQIFDVIRDNDAEKIREIAKWAHAQGKESKLSLPVNGLSDAQVEGLISERTKAKAARDFARADAIRKQLAEAGIILEDTKDGVRWKRG
ncbi:MAG TPA: cysteine--tRNA ligase [Terriglobales bacterium]|jgi:cysteinyl-tRNA synthetase|nr:cysteine--tRNA ligase [Terriglobales bacterium]